MITDTAGTEWYAYETQQSSGYQENIRFATFPGVPRCSAADVHLLVWLHESEAHGSPGARPRKITGPLDRVRVYAAAAPEWAAAIGDGGSRNWDTHGTETVTVMPARIAAALAALEAMQGQPDSSTSWDYARELIAHEAASALSALWYANRNVYGSAPLGAEAIQGVLSAVARSAA